MSQRDVRRAQDFLGANYSPGAQSDAIQQFFSLLLGSPAGQSMLTNANLMGQAAQSGLATQLGRSGLNTSGVGRTVAGLSSAIPMLQRGNVLQSLFGQSTQLGTGNLMTRLQALPGMAEQMKGFDWGSLLRALAGAGTMGFGQLLAGKVK